MVKIQLGFRTVEACYGNSVGVLPGLLKRCDAREGRIFSEADIRLAGVENYWNAPGMINNSFDSSTLVAVAERMVKIILPYANGSNSLTKAARFGLGLINKREDLVDGGINLSKEGRWRELKGEGVYFLQRRYLKSGRSRSFSEAMKDPVLMTTLGHFNYVDSDFVRPADEVGALVMNTFRIGRDRYGYEKMMAQNLPEIRGRKILKMKSVSSLDSMAESDMDFSLGYGGGQVAFEVFGESQRLREIFFREESEEYVRDFLKGMESK